MKTSFIIATITLSSLTLFGQKLDKEVLKNEITAGAVLGDRYLQGASLMYKRLGVLNFRIRFDGEIVEEEFNHQDDYAVLRVGADRMWTLKRWRPGVGVDLFGEWKAHLIDSITYNNYQVGLMPFLSTHYTVSDRLSIGIEGGAKIGHYLVRSESKSGWDLKGLQGVILMVSYRL